MARLLDSISSNTAGVLRLLGALEEKRLAPVMLFAGPSRKEKRAIALGISQALVCEKIKKACGTCGPCIRVEKGSSESVFLVEPDGTQIKIEQTREIQNRLSLQQTGVARVVILCDADKLNVHAANSLLKSLEEPPPGTYFILIAPSQASILSTLRSRSQVVRFGISKWSEDAETAEALELRKQLHQVFIALPDRARRSWAFDQFKDLAPDRESAVKLISYWSRFVRDWSLASQSPDAAIYPGLRWEALSKVSGDPEKLFQLSQQAERDLIGNVDRTLVLENLWQKSHEALHGLD